MQPFDNSFRYILVNVCFLENLKPKKMKKLLVILFAAFIAIPVFPQLSYGLKLGVSTSSMTMDQIKTIPATGGNYTIEALTDATYGIHGGIFLRFSLLGIYVQPEILFATVEHKYKVTDPGVTTAKEVTQKLNQLDIPVMVGVKFGPIRVNAGPAAIIAIGSPTALISSPDFKDTYSKTSFGYQVGVGLDLLKKLTIDLRYEGSLNKYQNQIQNLAGTTKVNLNNRPNAFLFTLGLIF
jgi:opacity protein-like surface antigen